MWNPSAYVNAELAALMFDLHRWPADRKLPRGVTRTEIGSITRNVLSACILDDISFRSWRNADRFGRLPCRRRADSGDQQRRAEGSAVAGAVLGHVKRLPVQSRGLGRMAWVYFERKLGKHASRRSVRRSLPHASRLSGARVFLDV